MINLRCGYTDNNGVYHPSKDELELTIPTSAGFHRVEVPVGKIVTIETVYASNMRIGYFDQITNSISKTFGYGLIGTLRHDNRPEYERAFTHHDYRENSVKVFEHDGLLVARAYFVGNEEVRLKQLREAVIEYAETKSKMWNRSVQGLIL